MKNNFLIRTITIVVSVLIFCMPINTYATEVTDAATEDFSEQTELPVMEQEAIALKDGTYKVQVTMTGGSGRATIATPATVHISSGLATAVIEWNSPNYDYMMVNGEKYLPVNTDGNSVFEIPVLFWDKEMTVLADTTAMSVPHEIEYQLIFAKPTDRNSKNIVFAGLLSTAVLIVVIALVVAGMKRKKRESSHE